MTEHDEMSGSVNNAIGWAYWRKSLWNGADCWPVIIEIEDSVLSIRSEFGQVARSAVSDTSGRYTVFGTLKLMIGDSEYALVDYGGPASQAPRRDFVDQVVRSQDRHVRGIAKWGPELERAGSSVVGCRYSASRFFIATILLGLPAVAAVVTVLAVALSDR